MATKSTHLIRGQEIEQVNIEFTPGELSKHKNLLSCVSASVYGSGLSNAAEHLNIPVGNLSAQLNPDNETRYFSVENFERHIEKSGDLSVVYYLIEKFLIKRGA